jgi:hypothetical protein
MMNRQKGVAGPLFGLALAILVAPGVVAGCANETGQAPTWTAHPGTAGQVDGAPAADTAAKAAWAARPAYVRQDPRTEEAYAYAMASPAVLRWMPCYCGCGAMGHGSNLDCFFKPTTTGVPAFEEHASYCEICIDTALMAKQMTAQGHSLRAIREAVDATFGGAAPGTPTDLPPA